MKKKNYLLLIAMFIVISASAQRFEYQLGLKGALGVNFPGHIEDDVVNTENGLCYKYGFTGIYYISENYGLTTGFNILGANFSYKYNVEVSSSELLRETIEYQAKHKTTYCQIPILLKMRTDAFAQRYRIFGEIGYGLDILANGEYKLDGEKQAVPYRDVCSSFIVHLGMEMLVMNRSSLQFMIAYDNFFSNIQTPNNNRMTMSNLCFEVGFLF